MDQWVFDGRWRGNSTVHHSVKGELDWMIDEHYLGKWPAVVPCKLIMESWERPVGMCIFAYPPKQTMKRYGGLTWELARLWIHDRIPPNAETWLISQAVKHVKREHKDVVGLVSYADPSVGHTGHIYKAANWSADGMTDDERKTPRFDYAVNGKRYSRRTHVPEGADFNRVPRVSKHRFFYAFDRGS